MRFNDFYDCIFNVTILESFLLKSSANYIKEFIVSNLLPTIVNIKQDKTKKSIDKKQDFLNLKIRLFKYIFELKKMDPNNINMDEIKKLRDELEKNIKSLEDKHREVYYISDEYLKGYGGNL